METFKIGDRVSVKEDFINGEIVDIKEDLAYVEFRTTGGGGCLPFQLSELEHENINDDIMDKEEMFKKIVVGKGNHYCMFCDQDANFVITNENVSPQKEYPMCSECAAVFKQRIDSGLSQLRTKHDFITNAGKRRYEYMKEKKNSAR